MTIDWFLVSVAYFSLFTYGFIDNARGPVFPDLLKEFALTDSVGALFFFVASASALINNVFLSDWMERIGAYRVTQVYSLAQIAGLAVIGFGPSYIWTLIGAAITGLGFGGLGISVNILVAEGAPAHTRRQMLSGLHSTYGVSSLLAPIVVTLLYQWHLSWRATLASFALGPALVVGLTLLRPRVDDGAQSLSNRDDTTRERGLRPRAIAVFYGLLCTFYVVAELSIGTRLALLVRREHGFSIEDANALVSGYFVGLFVGRLIFAMVRLPLGNRAVLALSATAGFITYALGLSVHPAFLALAGLAFSVFYPCVIALINDEQGPWAGFVTTWCITLQAVGILSMHFLLGRLADSFGLGRALWLGPISLLFVLVCLLLKPRFAPVYLGKNGN